MADVLKTILPILITLVLLGIGLSVVSRWLTRLIKRLTQRLKRLLMRSPIRPRTLRGIMGAGLSGMRGDARGADSAHDWSTLPQRPLQARLRLRYIDRQGVATLRDIQLHHYSLDASTMHGYLHAYCHLRQAPRTFAMCRVHEVIDLDTGEVIRNLPAWLQACDKNRIMRSATGRAARSN